MLFSTLVQVYTKTSIAINLYSMLLTINQRMLVTDNNYCPSTERIIIITEQEKVSMSLFILFCPILYVIIHFSSLYITASCVSFALFILLCLIIVCTGLWCWVLTYCKLTLAPASRNKEHLRACRNGDTELSAVAEHAWSSGHAVAWDDMTVLDRSSRLYDRCTLEAWHIRSQPHPINRERGRLSGTYNILLPRRH